MVVALTASSVQFSPGSVAAAQEPTMTVDEEVQVLTSGPIHEAFAETVALDPEPGIETPRAPPPLIEEIPPESKPDGDVQWIPGYWAWDDEKNDYIWVSGTWRVPPRGRQWVPGYWTPAKEGYQWISGYWASVKPEDAEYLPAPPESVEVGPSIKSPSPDYTWIPGCWIWHYEHYAWRPGYWAIGYPDWIWVPDHYTWTPRGYLFVSGYWDYPVRHRGVLFAPVYFPRRGHLGVAFSFSPSVMIDFDVFDDSLFVRIRYRHYYYGDRYPPRYYRRGIYPWFSLQASRVAYDPIYAHQRWKYRNDPGWENRLKTRFRERREDKGLRPPPSLDHRTVPDKAVISSSPEPLNVAMPLDQAAKTKVGDEHFRSLGKKERREFSHREREVRTHPEKREGREGRRRNILEQEVSRNPGPKKDTFSRPPMMHRSTENAPPARRQALKTTPNVEPLQKKKHFSGSWGEAGKPEDRGQRSTVIEQGSINNVRKSGNTGGPSVNRIQGVNDTQQRRYDIRQTRKER